jgi:DNA-binding transcriptional LysR family regulator
MNQLDSMQIFVRVAELSSFTAAAESLGLPKATVSLAVQQLENLLGTRLLHRTTRSVQMTQDGRAVFERSKDLLADFAELQHLFRKAPSAVSGRLRVDMPIAIARDLVIPNLSDFLRQHPALELELSSTDRRVDLVREGFDCVLRVGALLDSSLIARPLGQYRMINCASPAYIAEHGLPVSLADLSHHRLVHYLTHFGGREPGFEYVDPDTPGSMRHVPMGGVLTVNNSGLYGGLPCRAGHHTVTRAGHAQLSCQRATGGITARLSPCTHACFLGLRESSPLATTRTGVHELDQQPAAATLAGCQQAVIKRYTLWLQYPCLPHGKAWQAAWHAHSGRAWP